MPPIERDDFLTALMKVQSPKDSTEAQPKGLPEVIEVSCIEAYYLPNHIHDNLGILLVGLGHRRG